MRIDFLTVVPEMLEPFINRSILKRATDKGLAEFHIHNLHHSRRRAIRPAHGKSAVDARKCNNSLRTL